MELEDMQVAWSKMTEQLNKQELLTNKLIMDMTQERYRNKISIISKYEGIGAIICFITAMAMATQIQKLDTWYFLLMGGFIIAFLIIVPSIVLLTIKRMKNIDVKQKNYKQTLMEYAKRKKQFLLAQRTVIYLNVVFFFMVIPVFDKLFNDQNVFLEGANLWYMIAVPIVLLGLLSFSKWGYGKYKNITNSAENIIKELEE